MLRATHKTKQNTATIKYRIKSYTKFPTQYAWTFIPQTICWYLHFSCLYLTIKEAVDPNFRARPIENKIAPKKPDTPLDFNSLYVLAKGLLTAVIVTLLEVNKFIKTYAAKVWTDRIEVGERVLTIETKDKIVVELI